MAIRRLTIDEHKQVAEELYAVDAILSRVLKLISGRVPVKISDQLLTFRGVDKALNNFRSDLDGELFNNWVSRDTASVDVYYGKRREYTAKQ